MNENILWMKNKRADYVNAESFKVWRENKDQYRLQSEREMKSEKQIVFKC